MKSKSSALARISVFVAILSICVTAVVGAQIEDKIAKSFSVQSGGRLVVEVDRGAIEITTAEVDVVNIEVARTIKGNESKATQILKDHVITTTQKENSVAVQAEYKGSKSSSAMKQLSELKVSYHITVPRRFDVNLKTAGDSIKVDKLVGKTEAYTSGGSLKFAQLEGPITGRTSGGSIAVHASKGTVDVETSGGGLDLQDIVGDVNARTSGGSIRAEKINGRTVVKTSGGGIAVAGIQGQIEAGTSGGSITAKLTEQPLGDCSFKTSGGSVTIKLGEKSAVDVDVSTSAGRVSTDFPVVAVIQGEQKRNELRGKINGGGPLITAQTGGGSIRLEKD